YEYRIYGVDANRSMLVNPFVLYPMFGPSDRWYSGCAAPATHGTVVDSGWTVGIMPCEGTCYPGVYVEQGAEALRPFVGRDVLVYGRFGWSIEGFGIDLDSFQLVSCTVTVEGSTWGSIKSLYK
ncbi:MAG: hypothetical protein ACE5G2_02365, partial [Candidatus Krumholzibacteriia bacterium]